MSQHHRLEIRRIPHRVESWLSSTPFRNCRLTSLKEKLSSGEVTVGSWMSLGIPAVAEIMADTGFEWLVIDLEHTPITLREAEDLVRVVSLKGLSALVRVSSNDPVQIKRVLDSGADGVIVPSVNSAEQARAAVEATRYPPSGYRGVGLGRAQAYGPGFDDYINHRANRLVVIAQIEHVAAVENLSEILAVPGIDGTIIGPYDLSGSVGHAGDLEHVEVAKLLDRYEQVSQAAGKAMGYHVIAPLAEPVLEKVRAGYTFLAFSTDFLFLGDACRRELRAFRAGLTRRESESS